MAILEVTNRQWNCDANSFQFLLSFSSSSNKPLSGLNFLSQAFWSLFGTKLFCHNINLSEDLGSYKDSLHSVDVDQNLVNSG